MLNSFASGCQHVGCITFLNAEKCRGRSSLHWLQETTPQNTRNSTKWSVKIFEEWQSARSNKVAANKSLGFNYVRVDEVQDLTVDIAQMSPLSLNF